MNISKKIRIISIFAGLIMLSAIGCKSKEYAVASKNVADSFPLKGEKAEKNPQFAQSDGPYAVIHTTAGTLKVLLYPKQAPQAVENFIALAKSGYYEGSLFDYAMKDVLVQGGKPKKGEENSSFDTPFADEFSDELHHFHGALAMANEGIDSNKSQFYMVASQKSPENEDLILASMYMNELIRGENALLNEKNEAAKLTEEEIKAFETELNQKIQKIGTEGVPPEANIRYQPAIKQYMEQGGAYHLDYSHTVFGQVVEGINIVDAMSQVLVDTAHKPKIDMVIKRIEIVEE